MKKLLQIVLCLMTATFVVAQENCRKASNFHLGVDLQTKYIWGGMEMMTNDVSAVYSHS